MRGEIKGWRAGLTFLLVLGLGACDQPTAPEASTPLPSLAKGGEKGAGGGKKGKTSAPLQVVVSDMGSPGSSGVSSDGAGPYLDGDNGVQVYLGAGGKQAVLQTFDSPRRLVISSNSDIWMSTVGQGTVTVEALLWAKLDGGRYEKMAVGSSATANGDIEFPWDGWTYKLRFLEVEGLFGFTVTRTSKDSWVIEAAAASLGRFRSAGGLQWLERIDMPFRITLSRGG